MEGLKCLVKLRALNNKVEETELFAWWEVNYSCISQDFTPKETSARAMFYHWADVVRREYPDGLIPIYWSINVASHGPEMFPLRWEPEPFAFNLTDSDNDNNEECFFNFYSYPLEPDTRKPINFMEIPVRDLCWRKDEISACSGFIQEYTGWKPSILQPYIHLPALEKFAKLRERVEESGRDVFNERGLCFSNKLTYGWHERYAKWKEKQKQYNNNE